tara:strand:+ start:4594 stop:4887 length:294 start_codon:yes stop_codon:yes gene_type:complete
MNKSRIPITLSELKTFVQSKHDFDMALVRMNEKGSTWWEIVLYSPRTNHKHVILNKLGKPKLFKKIESAVNFIETYCPSNKKFLVLLDGECCDELLF